MSRHKRWSFELGDGALHRAIVSMVDGSAWLFNKQTNLLEAKARSLATKGFKAPEWMIADVYRGRGTNEEAKNVHERLFAAAKANVENDLWGEDDIRYLKVLAGEGQDARAREVLTDLPGEVRAALGVNPVLNPPLPKTPGKNLIVAGAVRLEVWLWSELELEVTE